MSSNGNIDIELLAGLDINSSEQEIRNAIKIIQSKIRSGDSASIQIDAKLDDRLINNTLNKLQSILKTKEISIDTRNSIIQLQKEANAMMNVVTSANKAAKEKLEFTNANKKVEKSARDTADAIRRERDAMCSLDDIDEILERINAQGRRGGNVFQQFGTTLRNAFAVYSAANLLQDALYDIIDAGKESIETVKELNDAATALRMATGGSFDSVKQLVQDYNALGQELGAITTEVSDSADAWLRQGHSVADTNELIKDSMMLSKITSLNSADSTKYLTSAMQGYKVAVEDVVNVVSKLSAVDLESATDAAGLAEAMSRTAESARMAGVSMDRLLGMIATVGEVTQKSMSSIGESYKTIFSRMRDIKDGKLSVVGDDGEVENISNVETVLNQLGIKLRESNSEFRNFQEVLDDVANSWDSYSSVQQAAIAKAFSGVRQQENFAVMMAHYAKVRKYTDISANSEGVAEEKFGYYLESLEAKTNALKASLENLAAVTIDDELYGSVLDVTKSLVDATAASGLLKGALAGLVTAGSIYAFQHLAGYVGDATQSFSNLSEAMNMVSSNTAASINLNRLVDLTQGLSQSQTRLVLSTTNLNDAQKLAVLRAQGLSRAEALLQLQTWGVTSAQQGATAATITFGSAMRGLYMTLAANPLFVVATAVTLGVTLWNKYKESVEDVAQTAEKAREHYQSLADELSTLNEELKTTQDRLRELEAIGTDSLSLVEQEEYDKLCKTNEELERELRIKEALAKVAARESAEASENALTDESYTSNTQTNRDGSSKKVDNITYVEELVDRAARQKELLEEAKAELLSFENNWTGDDISMVQSDEWQYLNDVVTNAEKAIGETETAISEAYETLDEDASGLVDTFGNVVDGFEDTYNRVEDVRDKVENYFTEEPETTTKDSLEKQFGKVRVSSLSDEDLEIAYNLQNIGDMTFDELKEEIQNAKKEAKKSINIKVNTSDYLSNLESLSDGFEQISAIYKDVQDMGEFDFSALAKDSDFSKTFQGAGQAYQDFIDVVANSPSDINKCQSAFDNLVSEWFYAKTPLKDITDETYDLTVAWLKQQGVANAIEVANYALAQSKAKAWLATNDLTKATDAEIQKFLQENATIGVTKEMLYSLQMEMIAVNSQGLDFSQQIGQLNMLASAAGLAGISMSAVNTAARYYSYGGMNQEQAQQAAMNDAIKMWQSKMKVANQELQLGTVPTGTGGGSSTKDPHIAEVDTYKSLTDAVSDYESQINSLNRALDHTENLEEQIALNQALIQLYQGQMDALQALNHARDQEISQNVADLRSVGFDIFYDPASDKLQIKNREHINNLSQDIIEKYEDMIEETDELNDANKESAEQWEELSYSIKETADSISELKHEQFKQTIADAEHLVSLMENSEKYRGKDIPVYEKMMNNVLKERERLIEEGYEKNKELIQELEAQWIELYDTRLEREKEILELQLDDKDGILAAVENLLDEEIKKIDDQTDAIQKQIDALNKKNEEHKEAIELQKAEAELERLRNQRTRLVLRKGQGWVYESDQEAVKDAEETVADLKHEHAISLLEKQKEALEEQKEALEEYKDSWAEIPDEFEKHQNKLLVIQEWGADWEKAIIEKRTDVQEKFKDDYFELQESIWEKTEELENHMSTAYQNMIDMFMQMAETVQDATGKINGFSVSGNKAWYVNKDGKAPSQAQVGDIVYTKGGTYQITGKDENGKFTSTKLNDNVTDIPENMWGQEIIRASNTQLANTVSKNTMVGQDVVDVAEDNIDEIKKSIIATDAFANIERQNGKYTQDQIATLLENIDTLDGNSVSVDGNTAKIGDNTYAIEDLTYALNNFSFEIDPMTGTLSQDGWEEMDVYDRQGYWIAEVNRLKQNGATGFDLEFAENQLNIYNKKVLESEIKSLNEAGKTLEASLKERELANVELELAQYQVYESDLWNHSDEEKGWDAEKLVNALNKVNSYNSDDRTYSNKYDSYLQKSDRDAIKEAQAEYNQAKAQNDPIKMQEAHEKAEAIRNKYGYSGGDDGSKVISTSVMSLRGSTETNSEYLSDNSDANYAVEEALYDTGDKFESSVNELGSTVSSLGDNLQNAIEKAISEKGYYEDNGKVVTPTNVEGVNRVTNKSTGISHLEGSEKSTTTTLNGQKVTKTVSYSGGVKTTTYKDSSGNTVAENKVTNVKKYASGGTNIPAGIANVDEEGAELIAKPDKGRIIEFEYDGNTVFDANTTANIMRFANDPHDFISGYMNNNSNQVVYTAGGTTNYNYKIANVSLPNVTKPDEFWNGLMQNIHNEAAQWASNKTNLR